MADRYTDQGHTEASEDVYPYSNIRLDFNYNADAPYYHAAYVRNRYEGCALMVGGDGPEGVRTILG